MTPEQEKLIFDNYRLPEKVLKGLSARYRDEIIDQARLALVEAAESFDPSRGVKFTTYAAKKMKWAAQEYFRNIDTMTRGQRRVLKATGEIPTIYAPRFGARREKKLLGIDPVAWRKGLMMVGCP